MTKGKKMGATLSALIQNYFVSKNPKTILIGLDSAGKTQFFQKLNPSEYHPRANTLEFDVNRAKYKDISFLSWDLGSQRMGIYYWPYYEGVNSIIFMVDSNDYERIGEVKEWLDRLLAEEGLEDIPLLVYANKQDLKGMSVEAVTERLKLEEIIGRKWHIIGSSMVTGDGIHEGLEWLSNNIRKKK